MVCDTLYIISGVNESAAGHFDYEWYEAKRHIQNFKFWYELHTLYVSKIVRQAPQERISLISPRV